MLTSQTHPPHVHLIIMWLNPPLKHWFLSKD